MTAMLDIGAYFARIGYDGETAPTRGVLEQIHLAHASSIPFENLDILLGKSIRLDGESLQRKLVHDRRGGYCFEQNLLLSDVLQQLGFKVRQLAARVRHGHDRLLPRTHMTLFVDLDDGTCLADVGFGAQGPLLPVPVTAGEVCRQYAWSYRMVENGGHWVLQSEMAGEWVDLYAFTEEPQYRVDYEVASHYTSTHPDSSFTRTLTAQMQSPARRHTLRNRELFTDDGSSSERRVVRDDQDLLEILRATFGLAFPPGTRFPVAETAS